MSAHTFDVTEFGADRDGDGTPESSAFTGRTLPAWLRIERQGATFVGYGSADGEHWEETAVYEVPSPTAVQHVGLIANAYSAVGERPRAVFDSFRVE